MMAGVRKNVVAPTSARTTDIVGLRSKNCLALVLGILVMAGCGTVAAAPRTPGTPGTAGNRTTVVAQSATSHPTVPPRTATPEPGWTVLSSVTSGVAIDGRTVTTNDGSRVTLIRFRAGQVRFALHVGTQEPPTRGVALGANAQPAVGASERAVLLGAFNGGFKVSDSAWGVEVDGQVLTALVPGMASLVIDTNGTARIGVWGETVPVPLEAVNSVRQNLYPLVIDALPSPSIGNVNAWGSPWHGVAFQARSALGQDTSGNLIYAASMGALPIDLANALMLVGTTMAMQLDINPEWVQADVATGPGGALAAMVPGQNRPSNQFLLGWTRDFVTVDATPGSRSLPVSPQH